MENKFDLNTLKKKLLIKFPVFGSVINNVKTELDPSFMNLPTAATNGKTIYFNSNFMNTLTEKEQLFVYAHEICHIALKHLERSKDKDPQTWNMATDAVINKHLENEKLQLIDGCVNIDDALSYDAEELYNKLIKEKQEQEKNGKEGNPKNSQSGHDDHSIWEEVFENEDNNNNENNDINNNNQQQNNVSEKDIFNENKKEKEEIAKEIMKDLNNERKNVGNGDSNSSINFGKIDKAKYAVANWKKILRTTLDLEDERWGHKFSSKENGYTARIEDCERDELPETEIILDVSDSVSENLLLNFLKQIKPIVKNTHVKIGTFSNNFHGWQKIKNEKDLDNLKLPIGGGTNFNAASEAFSKNKEINKICFTDGEDNGNAKIQNKRKDIIWISFKNKQFKPDFGKVIYAPKSCFNLNKKEDLTF